MSEDVPRVMQGGSRDYCPEWPDDGHTMIHRSPAGTNLFIQICDGCEWIDGEDLERQVAERYAASVEASEREP